MLGQTLPCPKCKGPISVPSVAPLPTGATPPVPGAPSAPGTLKANAAVSRPQANTTPQSSGRPGMPIVDSTAMTKVGDFDWNEVLANEELASRAEAEGETGLRFRTANEPDFIPIPSTLAPITPLPVATSSGPINKQAWQTSQHAKRKQWLTLITILIAGSLFAVVGFVAFMRAVGTKGKSISGDPTLVVPKQPELSKPEIAVAKEPESSSESTPVESTPVLDGKNTESAVVEPKAANNESPENKVGSKSDTATDSKPLQTATQDMAMAPPTAAVDEEASLPDAFGSSIPPWLLSQNTPIPTIVAQDNGITELNIEDAEVNRDQQFHREPTAIPSWEQRSKSTFSSFRVKDMSLLRCIDVFGRYTGVGISIDWESCRVAGIDLRKKIDIDAVNQSVAEMMAQLIKDHGLNWTIDASGIPVISAPKTAVDAKTQLDWSIAGLFPADSEQQGCESLLRLWGYDDVCKPVDGKLQWTEQSKAIERANLASSLHQLAKLQNRDWNQLSDASLLFSPNQWNASARVFDRRIRSNVIVPEKRPITDLLMSAAGETQLNLVIDWQHAWAHGLTPNETAVVVLSGRKFPQVAKKFLSEYALELMPISEDTVLLTTRETRRKMIRVVPLRLPKNFKVDDLKQSLRALAPVVDEESKFRIVPIPGSEDLFFARICTPRVEQLYDPDIMLGLGWPDRQP